MAESNEPRGSNVVFDPEIEKQLDEKIKKQEGDPVVVARAQELVREQMETAEQRKARETLEKQDTGRVGPPNGVRVTWSPGRDLFKQAVARADPSEVSGKKLRFINRLPLNREIRRYQGWEPIKDPDGKEITVMDTVLAGMPQEQHKKEIAEPLMARRQARRAAPLEQMKGQAAAEGMETFGGVKYDAQPPGGNDG